MRGDDGEPEQPRFAQRRDQPAAAAVDVLLVDQAFELPGGKALDFLGERPMRGLEERPVEEAAIGHQSPSNTGLRLLAKASKARRKSAVVMQIACASASASRAASRPMSHS